MSRFVLIPGAGGAGWYWHRVIPLLEAAGHQGVALDLPADDETAGLPEYADLAAAAARQDGGAGGAGAPCWWPSRWAASPRRWSATGSRWTCWSCSTR